MVRLQPGTMMRLAIALLLLLPLQAAAAATQTIRIGYLGVARAVPLAVGPLDEPASDEGLAGVRLGLADNRTTGAFTGQSFDLVETIAAPADIPAAVGAFAAAGAGFVVADLDAADLLAAADAAAPLGLTVLNIRAPDDTLRNEDCRANLLHTAVSRAMRADGLAQYLVWKRWTRWFLVVGPSDGDRLLADAFRRAATRFGAEIVEERDWTFQLGNGRSDTGHVTLQTEIPTFTRAADHDVLVVADEGDVFGAWLDGRTDLPRPVAGTHGLVAAGWSPVAEQWGATQLQGRFREAAGRWMTPVDYAGWLAVRAVGEAAVRTGSDDPAALAAYLAGPDFLLAGFKGQGLTFRDWDGQMRQPVPIAGARLLVSVSPQEGFLHEASELDTLGTDREESLCAR